MNRSPEERERARLEREARRTGKPVPAAEPGAPSPKRPDLTERANAVLARRERRPATPGQDPATGDQRPARARFALPTLIITALVAIGALWFLNSLYQPFAGDGGDRVRVVVPRGGSVGVIAERLEAAGVIDRPFFFRLRARFAGNSSSLKPGSYVLRKDMAYADVLEKLEKGPPRNVINVTIPEGRARREVAPLVRQAGLGGSYTRATVRSSKLNPRRYGAKSARNLEGFLFPATFELKRGATVRDLVDKQLQAFRTNFAKVNLSYARRKNLTAYDVLIIASMIEREAQIAKERPIVASVIYNRLKSGDTLGIDATLRFALNNWTKPLKVSELQSQTPYNTRINGGLPPGPIGSPGLASIKAAARPARTSFLFYVVKPGTCGRHAFSRTNAEFNRDVARYNRAREAKGGKSPDTC